MAEASIADSSPVWMYQPPASDSQIQEAALKAKENISLDLIQEFPVQFLAHTIDGELEKTDCQLVVDLIKNIIVVKTEKLSDVRYIGLRIIENVGPVLILSSRDLSTEDLDNPSINFMYFQTMDKDLVSSIAVINAVRRFQFEMVVSACAISLQEAVDVVNFNHLCVMGELPCQREPLEEKRYFCVMDRECLCLFPSQFSESPIQKYFFWKEPGPYVVENIVLVHGMHAIQLICESSKVKISTTGQGVCKEFENTLKNVIFSQPKVVFRDYKELYSQLQRSCITIQSQSSVDFGTPQRGNSQKEVIQSKTEAAYLTGELDIAEEICKSLEAYEDMIAPLWVLAEEEMNTLLSTGIVPETDIYSGGFDPDSYDHLMRCLQDVGDKVLEQSYELALSRIIGVRKIFGTSSNYDIRRIFAINDDLSLLKKIFFRNFSLQRT